MSPHTKTQIVFEGVQSTYKSTEFTNNKFKLTKQRVFKSKSQREKERKHILSLINIDTTTTTTQNRKNQNIKISNIAIFSIFDASSPCFCSLNSSPNPHIIGTHAFITYRMTESLSKIYFFKIPDSESNQIQINNSKIPPIYPENEQ